MSIAEKVLQLKQDFDNVYKAGQESGGGSGDYEQGYEDGKNSVVPLERYTKSLQLISLNIFGKKEVVLDLDNAKNLNNFCNVENDSAKNITVEKIIINCPNQITNMQNAFYCNSVARYDNALKHITLNVDTQKVGNYGNAFVGMNALEIIDGQPLDFSSVINVNYMRAFVGCSNLVECRFVANSIKLNISFSTLSNLSTDTIQSIIDGLADLTGGTAQTLTLHAIIGAKLTDTQKVTITAKNWTLVY